MKLLIELDEEYVKVIDRIKFLVGGRTDRKLQLEIIKAIKNGTPLEQEPTTKNNIRDNQVKNELNRVKNELEPTNKNDLGVDCIVDVLGSYTDLDIPYKREIAENIITKLSSVTSQEPIKSEPMQVDLEGDGYADGKLVYDYGKCPKCGWDFEEGDKDWEQPYCCHCGQKLKWFDNDAESEE